MQDTNQEPEQIETNTEAIKEASAEPIKATEDPFKADSEATEEPIKAPAPTTATTEGWDIKTESKLLKHLDKEFKGVALCQQVSDAEALARDYIAVMDPSNYMMLVAKTERAKLLAKKLLDPENKPVTVPELKYGGLIISKSKYGTELLKWIIDLFDACQDEDHTSTILQVGKDYPITAECDDFKVILAPRVDND